MHNHPEERSAEHPALQFPNPMHCHPEESATADDKGSTVAFLSSTAGALFPQKLIDIAELVIQKIQLAR